MWSSAPLLAKAGHLLLDRFEDSPRFELIVVMVFSPLVMNLVQFWMQDTFLKEKRRDFPPMHCQET